MTVLVKKVVPALFKVLDEAQGIVEQWVSVFGVKDYVNDRVLPGAFDEDLAAWKASGDPIPVVFSHQWENLDAFVGQVIEAEAMKAGDVRLPEGIREFGALYAKYQFDMEEPSSRKLLKLMKQRIIRQASFSYDVLERQTGKDGANELVTLHLHEVGPCLVGVNSLTDTGMVKSGAELPDPETIEEPADPALVIFRKEGRRNSTPDAERIQAAHDLFAELGAVCATAEDPEGASPEGKAAVTEDPMGKVAGKAVLLEAELLAISG